MHVPEQELTKQEEQAYLRAAEEELIKEFPGDNESVNCIRMLLSFVRNIRKGMLRRNGALTITG